MNNSKTLVALVVIAIIATLGLFVPVGKEGTTVVEKLGAMPGPEISSPFLSVNGLETWYHHVAARNYAAPASTASSTVCAIKSPAATSTLIMASISLSTGATTTSQFNFAKSATPYATTTLIGTTYNPVAGARVNVVASSTIGAATEVGIFAPSQYLVVKFTGVGNSFSPVGYCNARFEIQ